jgi:hypothetical protein
MKYAIGDAVVLTQDGAEFGRDGVCEVVTKYTAGPDDGMLDDMREFFVEGAIGEVVDTRYGYHECLVRFATDPVEDRKWWMCEDELVKVVE